MEQKKKEYTQTVMEEIANSITHGLGFGLSVAGLTILVVYASIEGDPWRIAAFAIYGASLTVLYLVSTLYHSFTHSRIKAIFRRLDHSAIYLLIAGTYTPIILISLRTTWVLYLLPVVWTMAIVGIYITKNNISGAVPVEKIMSGSDFLLEAQKRDFNITIKEI